MIKRKSPNQYHHGQLKRALLQAIDDIVSVEGVEALSLRECARRAGVSHGAPAHHFGDKRGMLTAYAIEGFERLMGTVAYELDAIDRHDPHGRLKAFGMGYVDFANKRRAQFTIMHRNELLDAASAEFEQKRWMPFELLKRIAAEAWSSASQPGWSNQHLSRLSAYWSLVHGTAVLGSDGTLATLGAQGMLDPRVPKILDQAIEAFRH